MKKIVTIEMDNGGVIKAELYPDVAPIQSKMPTALFSIILVLSTAHDCGYVISDTHKMMPAQITHIRLSITKSIVSLTVSSNALWRIRISVR